MAEESGDIEARKDAVAVAGRAKYWQQQIELSHKDHRDFLEDGREVVKRYKGEKKQTVRSNQKRFNILFSNTETLRAAVFARMAKPDIRRRFADRDPVGKQVAEIVERSAIYCQDAYDSEKQVERAIEDYLLPGRGIVKVCYEAQTAKAEPGEGETEGKEYVAEQTLYEEYVNWDDFRHEPAKTWDKVTWIAFRHRMSRDDLHTNFDSSLGATLVEAVPLNWSPSPESEKVPDAFKRAEVWEIWDKTERDRYWMVPGFDRLLREDEDPYGLEDFYPIAEPLQAVASNDTFIPRTEFSVYQDQADGLDEIEARIDRLTRALKRRGVYDSTFKELARLSKANDNEFVPVKNYADLSQKGGLAAAFQAEDLASMAQVLGELHQQRDLRVQTIYEVVGIADIMRGSSDPRETLGAQKIKAQFGGNRLKKRQDKVQKWIRDTLRIKCEIIAEHFEPQKLAEMTGFTLVDPQQQAQIQMAQQQGQPVSLDGLITSDMIKVMRNDKLRSYRVDVETDSTVFEDAESEKQAVTEMVTAASKFVESWLPVIQAQPAMLDMAFEMLSFALRRFKAGRTLEDVIEQTRLKLQQAASQPKPPDPKVQAEQAKAQVVAQQAQLDMQAAQQKHQMEMDKLAAEVQAQRAEMDMMMQELGIKREAAMIDMAAQREQAAMDAQSRQADMAQRANEMAMASEAAQQKHDMGLQMMAAKAKQAKQGSAANR